MTRALSARLHAFGSRLREDASGLALTEFAFAAPLLFSMGLMGVELSSLALAHQKVNQVALSLADNMSRVGEGSPLALKKIYESDVNDSFAAATKQGASIGLAATGRVIMSSLTLNPAGGQWIQWQRCFGSKAWPSSYGAQGAGSTGNPSAIAGMGPAGNRIAAPPSSAVIFVEIAYDYRPLFTSLVLAPQTIKQTAAFIVRDKRDLTQIYQRVPAAPVASC